MAKDGGGKVGFCSINVILTDDNDNTPQFRAAEYKVNVASDAPRGTSVIKIVASDADEGSNADIVYVIEADSENVEENFEIDPFTGVIVTKESLIGLENKVYAFYVRAKDAGTPPKESVVPVYIRILTPEVPLPKFVEPHYAFAIPEDLAIGSEIDCIQAESEQSVVYSLVKGNTPESNRDEVFVIDKDTGKLKLEKNLDHETTKWYQLTLLAQYAHEDYEVVSSVDISIQLKDANDNSPVFESNPYRAFVAENLPGGTRVIQVKATDLDSSTNGQVIYSLAQSRETNDIMELFAINSETGWITTLKELDHEKQGKHMVTVVASDRGEKVQLIATALVEVTVADVNDNPPRFTAEIFKGTVSEDDPPGGVIAILSTTDADTEQINKQVNYYITGGDPLGQFAIEQFAIEWKVYVRKPLDREEKDNYLLNITATDGTFVAKAVVEVKVLDANDNSPVCEKALYAETIPEDVPSGKLILQVSATDADIRSNAEISYRLFGTEADKFSLDPDTGELKTLVPLDREHEAVYNITVKAIDGGGRFCQADVVLTLEDVNDNAPEFSSDPYTVTVFENTELKTLVTRIQATDPDTGLNSKVLYSFVDSADGHFSIDELSGIISLEKPLDREVQAMYSLTVRATDQGSPRKLSTVCSVVVSVLDINDNPPVFEHREYAATVSEDITVGTQILRVFAASRDIEANAEISYSIASGNEHGKFSVDSSTDINDNTPKFSRNIYAAVISEDAVLGQPVITVMADDADGPSNNHIHYSIVNGNQGSPFTIDSVSGEVKVARWLDREKISGYTLTVQATDNGSPPKSNTTTINIDVSDVNDNPPAFSQANHSIIIQENRPVGASVLQLLVTDKDASHNGPPFSYTIISGNEENSFEINQQGALIASAPLNREIKDHHLLHVQVADSGKPQLHSSTFISIRVIEESIYAPAVLPLEMFITTHGDEFSGGVIGKIHATDQDIYDTLTYSLASKSGNLFSLSSTDGKLIARKGLDVGHYPLNVTVTDGRFTVAADINVHVRQFTQEVLNHSIAVRFANIAPEEFIGDYWRNFQRALTNIVGVKRNDIKIVSLQPSEPSSNLDVLLAVEKAGSSYHSHEVLFRKLNTSVADIEEMTGVRILKVINKLCSGLDCPLKFCDEIITLDKNVMSTYSTARLSFVTPRHQRTAVCLCKGGKCPTVNKLCEGNPCPEGTECVPDKKEGKYSCVCPSGKNGKCLGGPSLTFNGNSYAKYRLMESENKEEMKLSLKLRTYSAHAVVMYAKGTDYSILEINNGRLQYKFDCGSGPGVVSVHSILINDGEWHSVSLEVDGNYAKLVLDRVHTASGTAPGVKRNDIQIVSLQPSEPSSNLDVLLAVEKAGSSYHSHEVLFRKLNTSVADIEEMTGVRILKVINKLCSGLDCPLKFCDEIITLDKNVMSTYSTARLSFVTPRHQRTAVCLCKGGKCPTVNKLCEGYPCPEGTECVPDKKEGKYSCVCPSGKNGKCLGGPSLTFNGNSYAKYRLMESENKEEMKLSLKLRTYSAHAVVMYAKGTDYSILEINNGRLQYKFDCGSGPGVVSVHSILINDGEWHSVSLEVDGNYAKLVLDRVHTASGTAPGTLRTLNLDNNIFFGGHVRQLGSRHGRSPQVSDGLKGCMESIVLNGQELPLNSKPRAYAVMEEAVEVSQGCSLVPAEGCFSSPCNNGGLCSPLPNGGYFCKCSALFMGTHCEMSMSPCASNPCLYGGTCIPINDDFVCQCRGQYSGQRCQLGPYCKDNPCKNSGKCIDSLDGPVCECEPGFLGERCLTDIDECIKHPCSNGGLCKNTHGSYNCTCNQGYSGKLCEDAVLVKNVYLSTSWNIGLEEVIGIVVFVASIFLLVLLFVIFRKRVCRQRQSTPNEEEKHCGATTSFLHMPYFDSKMSKNIYSDVPPQVPVLPSLSIQSSVPSILTPCMGTEKHISYTPSIPSDSRNNLDRNSFEGSAIPEHPEFSTFNPDSMHGHRKAVAVCSVAPNLPPLPPSNSPSDSDSIRKPSWEYDYDTKVVDLDPCLSKKPIEESACHPYNTRGSMSEVQSLSSFQSDSCDDNGYHWDTSDWMPSVQLPGIQEFPQFEIVEAPAQLYTDPNAIDTDYYPGGYDIESDFPPPPDDFPVHEELPPLPEYNDQFESIQHPQDMPTAGSLGSSNRSRQRYNLNQYLPHHYNSELSEPQSTATGTSSYKGAYPLYSLGYSRDFEAGNVDNMSMSLYTSTASCSDVSACCEESEVMMSDYESGDEGHFDNVTIPPLDPQQHTEV
ncbi:UNVERIFIED_CONTAM: hypothetical protein FKN15_036964 [Acipenser sinensis]